MAHLPEPVPPEVPEENELVLESLKTTLAPFHEISMEVSKYLLWAAPSQMAIVLVVFVAYFAYPKKHWQNLLLLALGMDYAWHVSRFYVVLLLGSGILEWWLARSIYHSVDDKKRFRILLVSAAINVAIVCLIVVPVARDVGRLSKILFGSDAPRWFSWLTSSLAISTFYAFSKFTLSLDAYYRKLKQAPELIPSLAFVALFTRTWGNPMDRARDTMPQLEASREWRSLPLEEAFWLILVGGLKCSLSSGLGALPFVFLTDKPVFLGFFVGAWLLTINFWLQFSGVIDFCRGLAALFGIRIAPNFDAPLQSVNIADFWRRWNTSFGMWLGTEIFSKVNFALRHWGMAGVGVACLVTFLFSAVSHGLEWAEIAWAVVMGISIFVFLVTRNPFRKWVKKMGKPLWITLASWFVTIHLFVVGNGFAVYETMQEAGSALRSILSSSPLPSGGMTFTDALRAVMIVAVAACLHSIPHYHGGDTWMMSLRRPFKLSLALSGLAMIVFSILVVRN